MIMFCILLLLAASCALLLKKVTWDCKNLMRAQARDTHLDTGVTFVGLLFLFRAGGLVMWDLIPGRGRKLCFSV